ncbi:LamG-like jellyroll fold domain-containing protein [Mariniflexile litorale]|uniref:LamG-like jellyroll fold domain-containing protein n=1 Tax=Mariniflexile litorale TaxID=3045158 RepID=A0AAU7ECJ0_9FLAO|nr:LamG-like jellyroll fold domain-containing protein [Mariniflexile sp. KMM 9835]MDQ8212094.1 T9SS type A sorting domain-containing protein [Mariniflexile sp. KMM 9835]
MKKIAISLKLCTFLICLSLSWHIFSLSHSFSTFTLPISESTIKSLGVARDESPSNFSIRKVSEATTPEIDITGLGYSIPGDLSNVPILTDNTDFGTAQITSEIFTKTFVINNTSTGNLTLGAITLSGSSHFSIISNPAGSIIPPGGTANIVVSYNSNIIGIDTTILTIISDDSDEGSYQINLKAEANKVFFDSDGDGVYDDVDVDDDNDGIPDSIEENNCRLSSGSSLENYKFLSENFGSGTGRGSGISSLYTVSTTYCLEDGLHGSSCLGADPNVGDGKYTIASHITSGVSGEPVSPTDAVSNWAWYAWAPIEDHTPNDTNGRMAIFNAHYDSGIFYETQIKGTLANVPVTYSFWVINIDNDDSRFSAGELPRIKPNVTVNFLTFDKSTLLASFDTGDITRCSGAVNDPNDPAYNPSDPTFNSCITSEWKQFTQQFTTSETAFIVQFVNNAPGGSGNDLAIDDIEVRQTLCDIDSDGVADVFDLDSDDDGIPDVVEGNPNSAGLSEGKATLTGVSTWIDANGDGMHDLAEGYTPINSDGDNIPDYLDLDSDNDGIFDVDEYGVISSNASAGFQNGDGDITGNGMGDGPETEAFREKNSDGDGAIEYYGDGILDVYDFHHGAANYTDSYGNIGQGTAPLYALDSDNDGIPDYRDPKSNRNGHPLDIDNQEIYTVLFPHDTNGVLLSTVDLDGDGIVSSRDGDDTVFGSPRNLNNSYSLYFDGRNDYVEDSNIISSGEATLMAFIKSDGANTNSNNRMVAGQSDFYIRVNTNNTITAVAEGVSLTSTSIASLGIWMHVAVTTTSGSTILYINGMEEARDTAGGITSNSNFTIGRATTNNNYFKGEIDEVRVFNTALTANQLKRMVYQELDEAHNFNRGKIIPLDISTSIGTNLVKYYKMDAYNGDILDDKKTGTIDQGTGAKMYNFKDIYFQRAPLPYITNSNGNWTNSANWLYGNEWDITTKQDNPNGASIVNIKHNINLNGSYSTQGMVGLFVDAGKEFSIEASKGLYNNWYLKLDGLIDLDAESQLIQTDGSLLDVTSAGKIERDQQGTKDYYTYNYWSSPVGISNTTSNNNSYKMINNILKNGTISATPTNITFLTSGYDGSVSGTNISISDYWIWKYANGPNDTYSYWQHVRRNGTLLAGEGFSMKGVANTGGAINQTQNYVFNGKPNNGDITLNITAGNDYLVGNPYPSALDADEFIKDNISNLETNGRNTSGNIINGTLYFWDHFASNTHILGEYQGGYATYTLMGGAPAVSNDTRLNATGAVGTKIPEKYIPIGQGFFVHATLDANLVGESNDPGMSQPIVGGAILFQNSQRIFVTEASGSSLFLKNSNPKSKQTSSTEIKVDNRQKIRLKFDSPTGYHRQLLAGVDEKASNNFDIGYDALLTENNNEDMFWVFNNSHFIIQAVNNFDEEQALPLGIKINKQGIASIKIDALENIDTNMIIYLHDKELNAYHNLKESKYEVYLTVGNHLNRFEVTFAKTKTLNSDTFETNAFQVYFSNENKSIVIHNPTGKNIESTEILNMLGQSVYKLKIRSKENIITQKPKDLSTGTYIIKLKTDSGIVSKKVLIN